MKSTIDIVSRKWHITYINTLIRREQAGDLHLLSPSSYIRPNLTFRAHEQSGHNLPFPFPPRDTLIGYVQSRPSRRSSLALLVWWLRMCQSQGRAAAQRLPLTFFQPRQQAQTISLRAWPARASCNGQLDLCRAGRSQYAADFIYSSMYIICACHCYDLPQFPVLSLGCVCSVVWSAVALYFTCTYSVLT